MIKNLIIAGKNNIAIEITQYVLDTFPSLKVYTLFNDNDDTIDTGWQSSFKKYCLSEPRLHCIDLEQSYNIDNSIFLSLEFDKIIEPSQFLTNKIYNIHFSFLPEYRGVYTSALPLLHGKKFSGVTLHEIDKGIDSGRIIAQWSINLSTVVNAGQLYSIYCFYGAFLLKESLPSLFKNVVFSKKQNDLNSSYYSRSSINYRDVNLNIDCSAEELLCQVKALTFRQFQLPTFNGYQISSAKITNINSKSRNEEEIDDTEPYILVPTNTYFVMLIKDRFQSLIQSIEDRNEFKWKKIVKQNPSLVLEVDEVGNNPIRLAIALGDSQLLSFLLERAVLFESFKCFQNEFQFLIDGYTRRSQDNALYELYCKFLS